MWTLQDQVRGGASSVVTAHSNVPKFTPMTTHPYAVGGEREAHVVGQKSDNRGQCPPSPTTHRTFVQYPIELSPPEDESTDTCSVAIDCPHLSTGVRRNQGNGTPESKVAEPKFLSLPYFLNKTFRTGDRNQSKFLRVGR